jgi:hypothetical protein
MTTKTRRQVLELGISLVGTFSAAGAVAIACSSESSTPSNTSSSSSSGSSSGGSSGTGSSSGSTAPKDAAADTSSVDATQEFACRSSISVNHGHTLVIPVADLESTTSKTYSIIGSSDHDHQVTFDAQQLADLKAGVSLKMTSTMHETHDHEVSVKCS